MKNSGYVKKGIYHNNQPSSEWSDQWTTLLDYLTTLSQTQSLYSAYSCVGKDVCWVVCILKRDTCLEALRKTSTLVGVVV